MKRITLAVVGAATLLSSVLPAGANPPAQRDVGALVAQAHQRFVPKAPGTTEDLSFVYGPFEVGPGQDRNLITAEVPLTNVHLTAVAPELVDATDGSIPTEQEAHIHHAHWFSLTTDAGDRNCYTSAGGGCLAWVFGTGEEKTQGRFTDRADVVPSDVSDPLTDPIYQSRPGYGIYIDGSQPQALIFMVHNKTASPLSVMVVLDVTVIHGDAAQIEAATGRPMHTVRGTLWGQTADATTQKPYLEAYRTFSTPGTAIAAGSHLHPGGKYTVVANLGPNRMCAGTDPDGDGWPGVTILNSKKFDRIDPAGPFSEEYQMGATKFGWRAPIHTGDVLAQYAPYANYGNPVDNGAAWNLQNPATFASPDGLDHQWYEGMTYTGIYIAADEPPAPLPAGDAATVCTVENFGVNLVGDDTFRDQGWSARFPRGDSRIADLRDRFEQGPEMGMINHLWVGPPDPLCGLSLNGFDASCNANRSVSDWDRIETDTVHIAGFLYAPGDLGAGGLGGIPVVTQGQSLRFINEDVALGGVRHSVTSCQLPCDGPYVSNYPAPDGVFDSGKLGNLDYIDGGLWNASPDNFQGSVEYTLSQAFGEEYPWMGDRAPDHHETLPFWSLDTSDLDPGRYAFFCRLHPFMRGTFEVAPAA